MEEVEALVPDPDTLPVHCEWGAHGAGTDESDITVVVDVLSFTTAVAVAVARGIAVYPSPWDDHRARALGEAENAAVAAKRRATTVDTPWSLSPAALRDAPTVARLVLTSPNGSAIAAAASGRVVAACLRNATATAAWLRDNAGDSRRVVVVPAGERWPDGSLRPAIEDLLGAGAVIAALTRAARHRLSPEAKVAHAAFSAVGDVAEAVRRSTSGVELAGAGFAADVDIAVEIDVSEVVPVLENGCFVDAAQKRGGSR